MNLSFRRAVLCSLLPATVAASTADPTLPRRATFPPESHPGIEVEYGVLTPGVGVQQQIQQQMRVQLRTIVTRPRAAKGQGRLPAVLFVQWLSCDTIELRPEPRDGWSRMLRQLIRDSGALVWRTEKSGVGDSVGQPCAILDYDTEVAHHRAALAALLARPDVDPARVVVFGASMGATMAPLVAAGHPVRGVVTWGGGARSWLERQIAFDRRALELSGESLAGAAAAMKDRIEFHTRYLAGRTPADVVAERPDLAVAAKSVIGLAADSHYGRPFAFHWQAQAQDWAAAWAGVDAPVLALLGEYDWFEDPRSAELIALVANRRKAGFGTFHLLPRMDHHFTLFTDASAAFADSGGTPDPTAAMAIMLSWLRDRFR